MELSTLVKLSAPDGPSDSKIEDSFLFPPNPMNALCHYLSLELGSKIAYQGTDWFHLGLSQCALVGPGVSTPLEGRERERERERRDVLSLTMYS